MTNGRLKRNTITTISLIGIFLVGGFLINLLFYHKDAIEAHSEPCVYITPYGEKYHHPSCSYIVSGAFHVAYMRLKTEVILHVQDAMVDLMELLMLVEQRKKMTIIHHLA